MEANINSNNYYDILGVPTHSTTSEIKSAFRTQALTHHPDKGGSTQHFQKLQAAAECLLDERRRERYNRKRRNHRPWVADADSEDEEEDTDDESDNDECPIPFVITSSFIWGIVMKATMIAVTDSTDGPDVWTCFA